MSTSKAVTKNLLRDHICHNCKNGVKHTWASTSGDSGEKLYCRDRYIEVDEDHTCLNWK